jgi:hypothetical protein
MAFQIQRGAEATAAANGQRLAETQSALLFSFRRLEFEHLITHRQ